MPKPLVIVESPAKARTIAGFLGRDFVVESSIGHIRDLPRRAADVPAAYKNEPWARLGVDVDNGFKPLYVLSSEKRQQVAKLRSLLKDASELYLATDEERERERMQFRAASYWDVEGVMEKEAESPTFAAAIVALDGRRLATGRDFDQAGRLTRDDAVVVDEERARALAAGLRDADFEVRSVEEKPYRRSPYPPFMTSTLQQE